MKKRVKAEAIKRGRGRPSLYTPELAAEVCRRIADGKSIRTVGKEEGMPSMPCVMEWLHKHQEFAEQYARAREEQADVFADEIIAIADDSKLDPNDKRVRVDARKWVAAKLKPKRYGDRLELDGGLEIKPQSADAIRSAFMGFLGVGALGVADGGAADPGGQTPRRGARNART